MGTTITSNSWTGDKCSRYWLVNAIFRLWLVWTIPWAWRPAVQTLPGSSSRPSHFRSLGALKMLVAPHSMRARTCCISSLPSLIKTSWLLWNVSSLDVPHKYCLDMGACGLSDTTLDIKAIQFGCMLSIATIEDCIANLNGPNCTSLNHPCQPRCQERPMRLLAADWRKTSVTSATTLDSVRNTRVFRTALTALTEPRTLWRRITRYP